MFVLKSLAVAVFALVASAAVAAEPATLTVYTYQSFASEYGPGPGIKKGFEAQCGCTLEFVAVDSAIGALRRIQLEGATSRADRPSRWCWRRKLSSVLRLALSP